MSLTPIKKRLKKATYLTVTVLGDSMCSIGACFEAYDPKYPVSDTSFYDNHYRPIGFARGFSVLPLSACAAALSAKGSVS